jgi:hypothetical protein
VAARVQIAVLLLSASAQRKEPHPRETAVPPPSVALLAQTVETVPETKLQAFVTPKHLPVPVPALPTPHNTHLPAALTVSPYHSHLSLHMSSPIMLTLSEDRTLAVRPVP